MIFISSVVNLSVLLGQRHPEYHYMPVIDYDCVVLLEPMLALGVTLGVLMNQIAPPWLLLVLLCITLGTSLWRTGKKGLKQWSKEQEQQAQQGSAQSIQRSTST